MEEKNPLITLFLSPKNIIAIIIIVVGLVFASLYNYLLFHTIIEEFYIILVAMIFIVTTTTYKYSQNNLSLFIGTSMLFTGIIDSVHLMAYQGLGIFPFSGDDISTRLWLAARALEAFSLFLAVFVFHRRFSQSLVLIAYSAVTALLIAGIVAVPVFPQCYIPGKGPTVFKIAVEWILALVVLISLIKLFRNKDMRKNVPLLHRMLMLGMLFFVLAEICMAFSVSPQSFMDFAGHMLKLLSAGLIFLGMVFLGIDNPYSMVSARLKENASRDFLTNLQNRRGLEEVYQREVARISRKGGSLGLLLIDLDNFKEVNDRFGHQEGDEALKCFAAILKNAVRETDVVCRMGGDEFLILANEDRNGMECLKKRVLDYADTHMFKANPRYSFLGISSGIATVDNENREDLDRLIIKADAEMYIEKSKHKSHSANNVKEYQNIANNVK